MAGLVVGIFPDSDAKALESALSAQQIDLTMVKVVTATPPIEDDEPYQIEFVDVIVGMESNSLSDDMTKRVGVWDETGTDVPGLGGSGVTVRDFTHHVDPTRRYLAGFDIPSDEVDNFGDAVAEGRSVVLYPDAGAQAEVVSAAFKAAGLRNVRAF
ncbi:MAG: hypothetical protein WB609_06645 [Candidatus Cybelea sp.]